MAILSIDAGTTGVTALVVDSGGNIISRGYREFEQYFPQPGWVEHEPEEIWQATLAAISQALSGTEESIECLGITNQRETAVIWNRKDLSSPTRAIVWQDRRTSNLTEEIQDLNKGDWIRIRTGLNLDPYFTSSKFLWWKRNYPELWADLEAGKYALGTIDSYLVARLSGGQYHITDMSNASRTQLMDIRSGEWDSELCEAFEVPIAALPKITSSWGKLAKTEPSHFLGLELEITGIAGDQQAALFGQTGFDAGATKCTYGTGAFVLTNTGSQIVESSNGLLSTVAWQSPEGEICYALEGSVFVAGAAVQWLRDGLGIISSASEIEELAASVPDSQGVCFVPALTGLGAPYWDATSKGTITGITRGTTRGHIARATLEAIALQVMDLTRAIEADSGQKVPELRVDGGASVNNLLLQIQADLLGIPIIRGQTVETTGLGAAFLAGLGMGIWTSKSLLGQALHAQRTFRPVEFDPELVERWTKAVRASLI
ncbi:MAG: FGGY family carbohydrate kinase [Actinomycetota bacterium]